MLFQWLLLVSMLVFILAASLIFTNAIEHLAHKLQISSGFTGSVLAAIATALPEASIPIIAIVFGTANHTANEEISVGAILGAPLMLGTLATALMALASIKTRGLKGRVIPEFTGFKRDLNCCLVALIFAVIAMFLPQHPVFWRLGISCLLMGMYLYYLVSIITASKALVLYGHGVTPDGPLIFTKFHLPKNHRTIALQLICALCLLVLGAKGFIHSIATISTYWQISTLVLALLIVPIATELPEKVNSIIWIRKHKDTLAFGNITGAIAFQGTLLPALGILLTPWQPSREVLTGLMITIIGIAWLRLFANERGITVRVMLVNGLLYLIYLSLIFIETI